MGTRVGNRPRTAGYRPGQASGQRRRSPTRNNGTRSAPQTVVPKAVVEAAPQAVEIPRSLSVKDLADILRISPVEVIKDLMKNGVMASINQLVDYDTAAIVSTDLGYEPSEMAVPEAEAALPRDLGALKRFIEEDVAALIPRPPIVTIMGHVDHGKTSLLDAIRETNVTGEEAGGITQHIGAYQVEIHGQKITFLDTPGHEAFTAMRARGAQITDIAVLVVAADDGVMPQTREAIDHAKAAGVQIIVAINKIDKPNANPDRVKQELAEAGLVPEDWGGNTICVPVSARRREGIEDLLENLLIVAEVAELKANPDRAAIGVVVEAELDKTKGPLATILVQTGTMKLGEFVVAGETYGRIKAMFNDLGKRVKKADPSMPVEVLGLSAVPQAGDTVEVVIDEKTAKARVTERLRTRDAAAGILHRAVTLEDVFREIKEGNVKELNLILKTDVQGSLEPIKNSVEKLSTEDVKVRFVHSGTGSVTESDVMLALASKAIIVGFNTKPETGAKRLAETEHVDVRQYEVIYNIIEDVQLALTGMLETKYVDVLDGTCEVRQVFKIGRHTAVAGSFVLEGKASRGAVIRVMRRGEQLFSGSLSSLKRFKDDAREVATGYECGIGVDGFADFEVGDIVQFYRKEKAS
ncbi:MAG: translation initiation factor IF-2 [Dehalococcoidia bacterium]|nr:translation initiation factor IF-2 [Dehalococcoidia bacterium]